MISIVIASIREDLLSQIIANVDATVGIPYEIIAVNNLNTGKGICEVYNEASKSAKYEYICFVHEDVQFKTHKWGVNVVEHLKDQKTGLIGIAGSVYRSLVPSGWFTPEEFGKADWRLNIFQGAKNEIGTHREYLNPLDEHSSDVICLDGVLLCTKKSVLEKHQFDDQLLKGFHGYDIDFSLNVLTNYNVKVVYDVLIEHFSKGEFESAWLKEIDKVQRKWKRVLPLRVNKSIQDTDRENERKAAKRFIKSMAKTAYFSKSEKVKHIIFYGSTSLSFFEKSKYIIKVLLR